MENKNKISFTKENVYAFILLVLFVFWTIASVLGIVAFFRSDNENTIVASAYNVPNEDTMVKVEEGDYEIPLFGLLGDINSIGYGQLYTVNGQYLTLICNDDGIKIRRYINNGTDTQLQTLYEDSSILTASNSVPFSIKSFQSSSSGYTDFSFTASILSSAVYDHFQDYLPFRVSYKFVKSIDNVSAIDIRVDWFAFRNAYNNDFSMEIRLLTSGPLDSVYSSYFSLNLQSAYSDYVSHRCDLISVYDYFRYQGSSYEVGFSVGEEVGYDKGYGEGYNVGRGEGYDIGLSDGKEIGYNNGLASGADVSWFGMFTAWFDVPIRALTGLFNFEFLGINLWAFFRALLTVAAIIAVVKFVL